MTAVPTPAEFLASTDPDEPDEDVFVLVDPLTSIAQSLRTIAAFYAADGVELQTAEFVDPSAELNAEIDKRQQVIDDVLEVCAKSKGQLAEKVRAVVDQAFAVPDVPEVEQPEDPEAPPAE
jgi:hypothetical protein